MIRPFHLRDARVVAHLQQVGISLDVEEQLTHPRSPLRSVLIDTLLFPHTGPSTFILDQRDEHGRLRGLAQMRSRPGRPERDVVFVSPSLDAGNGSHAIWQRLLTHLCIQAAERGNFRLYAGLPVASEELHLFKNVGFASYCQEDIYRLTAEASLPAKTALELRPQRSGDGWGLQKLYSTLTPRSVQNAEGLAQGQWALASRRWGEQGRRYGYVWEVSGELLGSLYLRAGKQGYWIRTLLHPDAVDQAAALSQAALNLINTGNRPMPIYFAFRQYELGWHSVLTELGFAPFTSRTLVVKPMTVRIRGKSPLLMPALEKSPSEGAATPVTGSKLL